MPSIFLGKTTDDPEIVPIHQIIREKFEEPNWHHSDEENFTDLLSRVHAVLEFIRSQKKENIVVVTHGYFLCLIIYYMLLGKNVSYKSFRSFRKHIELTNTGITVCEYKDDTWKLLTWNDYAHLGE